ncbi:MAG: hypothetical protein M1608_13305 [Candidatus Omnitrophica bacterium]|nr:hypothetical protein [Candidatus Omnitrophota bacterium]
MQPHLQIDYTQPKPLAIGHLAAIPMERIHSVLRKMPDDDWARLKALIHQNFTHPTKDDDIDVLERMFRKGEDIGRQAGGTVYRMVQLMVGNAALIEEVRKSQERMRLRIRTLLKEMSNEDWSQFKASMNSHLEHPTKADDIGVLELVFRIGESVSNVEIAALAMAAKSSGRKLIEPEVARNNAILKAVHNRTAKPDPEAAYISAKKAIEEATKMARRAQNTLASRYVEPSASYKNARNTVFKMVDSILESPPLVAEAERIEMELTGVKTVSRKKMRWALHRMPMNDRIKVIRLIPLNTILMFHEGEEKAKPRDLAAKATRDRRMAYDLFVKDQSDEELKATYGLSISAIKNAVGVILQTLMEKPLARKMVNDYVARMESVEPMGTDEVRRRMKQLTPRQRAEIIHGIPNSAWKVREVIPMHKHLFLDYLSGEWVLGALVRYYNLEKDKKLTGTFQFTGTLTARGAQSSVEGMLRKISDEPALRQQLRQWTSAVSSPEPAEATGESTLPNEDEVMPPAPE